MNAGGTDNEGCIEVRRPGFQGYISRPSPSGADMVEALFFEISTICDLGYPTLASNHLAQAHPASQVTRSDADGLTTTAGHATASSNTVLVDGATSTYRVIPTLPASIDETPPILPNIYDPQALDPQTVCRGYKASQVENHEFGFSATLLMIGEACNAYGTDIEALDLNVQYQSADRLRVRIRPKYYDASNASHYVISNKYVHKPTLDADAKDTAQANDLQFTWTNEPSFGFSVIRRSTGDILFDTKGTKIVYENQFIEFFTAMPKNYNVYGLGEVIHGLRLGNNLTRTIYNADVGDSTDGNIYGTHPFYLDTRYYEKDPKSGNLTLITSEHTDSSSEYISRSHGVFLRNAHGQEVLLRPDGITWRTLGGSIDLYFLSGPSQPEVTRQYQLGVLGGYPAMQQYFTFGYHQCRWGYTNISEMETVVDNFRKFDIPLETIWNDIDYMNQYRDFDNDQIRFGYDQARRFLEKLHANGQHYVPIVDTAIYHPNLANSSDSYETYLRGNASGSFLMNPDGSQYIGAIWPGYTVFADWRAEDTQEWWTNEMMIWHDKFDFDGIWLDMSEASSFCVGSCGSGHTTENPVHPPFGLPGEPGNVIYTYPEDFSKTNKTEYKSAQSASKAQASSIAATATPTTSQPYLRTTPTPAVRSLEYPPYALNNYNGALPVHALAPNATHADGVKEYDIHNLYGHDHLIGTYNALLGVFPKKRPFVIARSNFAGSGRYAGHWGGDNTSLFYYMAQSIPQALAFALFGIPMFGVDTCGFNGNSDEELCARWMELSSFFIFMRNHNTLSAISQEPYIWASVTESSKRAMYIRYSILPYIYTLFHLSNTTGSTVMRALAWEFPIEPSLAAADRQFMLGPSFLITPVLNPLARTVNGVFPGAGLGTVWYDWYTQTAMEVSRGENKTIEAPLTHIPVYVRGGSIVPMQQPGYTTAESRKNPWSLLVALDLEGSASGQLYLDDGESLVQEATRFVDFAVTGNSLYVSGQGLFKDTNALSNVTIMGVPEAPKSATLKGHKVKQVSYDSQSKVVSITGLNKITSGGAWNEDWVLSWAF